MDFDVDRMLQLSGLGQGQSDNEVLTESAEEVPTALNESTQLAETPEGEETLSEATLRNIIREELKEMLQNMKNENTSDASWLYGKKKPARSRSGQVTRGFFGLGFSNED